MTTEKKRNTYVWCEKARRYVLETPKAVKPAPKKKAAKKAAK